MAFLASNIGTNSALARNLTSSQKSIIKHNFLVSKHTIDWFKGPGKWSIFPHYPKCGMLERARFASLCAKQRHVLQIHIKRYKRLDVILHPKPVSNWLSDAFLCIHRYEGAWDANTGNGYYGGLQMDIPFQSRYGADYVRQWGTADNWPIWAQINAAVRAYHSGRGFYPWPNTARVCGLL